jgi:hypothetical protein
MQFSVSVYSMKSLALTLVLITTGLAFAAVPTLTVASPANNANVGSPVYFDATASTTTCASGISAIRIYAAPSVDAFTTESFHLETFVTLSPGTYNTVIQVWDNCGNITKASRTITVNSKAGVSVFLPEAGANTTPVHFVVSAQNPACAKGMSAVRIYPAPGVNAYTLNGSTLDAFINLIPGSYGAVAQAWDNCGNVYKTPVTINNTGGPPGKFLYVGDVELRNVAQYSLNNGVLSIPGGASEPPTYAVPDLVSSVVVDPSGNFAYAGLANGGVTMFEINRADGDLFSIGTASAPVNSNGPAALAMDPAGNFLFVAEYTSNTVAVFRINRNSGILTLTGTPIFLDASGPDAAAFDFTGRFVYTPIYLHSEVFGYSLNTNNGALTEIAGSPVATGTQPVSIAASGIVVYDNTQVVGNQLYGYTFNGSTGELTSAPGSPYLAPEDVTVSYSMQLDPIHNLLFYSAIGFTFGTDNVAAWTIESNGAAQGSGATYGLYDPSSLALDPSYKYLYVCQVNGNNGASQIVSASYDATSGNGTILSGPISRPNDTAVEIAVSP